MKSGGLGTSLRLIRVREGLYWFSLKSSTGSGASKGRRRGSFEGEGGGGRGLWRRVGLRLQMGRRGRGGGGGEEEGVLQRGRRASLRAPFVPTKVSRSPPSTILPVIPPLLPLSPHSFKAPSKPLRNPLLLLLPSKPL